MASDEQRDDLPASPDEAATHDGGDGLEPPADPALEPDVEPDDGNLSDPAPKPGEEPEPTPDLGDEAESHTCPMCAGEGTLPFDPPQDARAERCEDCRGLGTVYTGSLVEEAFFRPCGTCGGKGFNERAAVTPIGAPPYRVEPVPVPVTSAQYYDPADVNTWHLPPAPGSQLVPAGS